MARGEIGKVIEELVTLEKALTGTRAAYVEAPDSIASTPAWLNMPRRGRMLEQTGWSDDVHTLLCACVKRGGMHSGDERLMRPMITLFPDALSAHLTLNGTVAHVVEVRYDYGFIEVLSTQDDSFFGVLFEVDVHVKDVVEVAA